MPISMNKHKKCTGSIIRIVTCIWTNAMTRANVRLVSGWISQNTRNSRTAGSSFGPAVNIFRGGSARGSIPLSRGVEDSNCGSATRLGLTLT